MIEYNLPSNITSVKIHAVEENTFICKTGLTTRCLRLTIDTDYRIKLIKWRRISSVFERDTTSIRTKFWCYLNLNNEGELCDIKISFNRKVKMIIF